MKADLGLFLLNQSAAGVLFGWALLAATQVGALTRTTLAATLGAPAATRLPGPAVGVIATAALFLAYESLTDSITTRATRSRSSGRSIRPTTRQRS